MHFAIFANRKAHAYGIDGDIFRGLNFLEDLVQRELAERVETGGHQNDIFPAFDAIEPIERIEERVEHVRFRETRHAQLVQAPHTRRVCPG